MSLGMSSRRYGPAPVAALSCLASMDGEGAMTRDEIMARFYEEEAKDDALVLNKWFTVQAMADLPDILDRVKTLRDHPDFTLKNQAGEDTSLSSLLDDEQYVALVFYRSADW